MSSLKQRDIQPSGTTIVVEPAALETLRAHAAEGYPHEVVGILAGDRGQGLVSRCEALKNERATNAERRYKVNGLMLMKAEQRLEAAGLEIIGYYHSHPDHPAMYSDTDRDLALPNMSYVIASVTAAGVGDIKSWRLRDDREEMELEQLVSAP
ncbi:MAG: proteasome lid subunit RPN8/RPN11 [Myxococcota bacterium]|jgi:proteasome lid subunit RPN8/RPN11